MFRYAQMLTLAECHKNTDVRPQVGDPTKTNGVSAVYTFTCPRSLASGPSPYPFDLGMMADLGQTYNSTTTLANLLVSASCPTPGSSVIRQQSTSLSELKFVRNRIAILQVAVVGHRCQH